MKPGQVAVVTGAGSGIGRALALALDGRGASLVLADVSAEGLDETAKLVSRPPKTRVVDVSQRAQVEALAAFTKESFGRVDLVVNNAGVTVHDTVEHVSYEDFEWVMGVNFWGVVYGTKAFLPLMKAQGSGIIANVSSIFGIVGWPLQGVYNASKFAVRGFTEVLWRELKGTGVRAVSIHPGGIKTNIVRSMRFRRGLGPTANHDTTVRLFDKMARTTPAQCAATILKGLDKGERRILIGADAVTLDRLQRASPSGYPDALEFFEKRVEARRAKKRR
ncbi:MAG: SDR family oxidoreductase [Myxococcaceae bacterium]|jgi:NAD(P)-dependent dehydrogenase (short-subunit alcohol dehydrogenase family)|nr:SDR family oxidoreductase [Myxococcaceae bacterium]